MNDHSNPLVVQGDFTLLLEVEHPQYEETRDRIARFAELIKSPEYLHTYRITPLSVWNAASVGMTASEMIADLDRFSRYPIPGHILTELEELSSRFGRLTIRKKGNDLVLEADNATLAKETARRSEIGKVLESQLSPTEFLVRPLHRGKLKQLLIKEGFPALDLAGFTKGEPLPLELRSNTYQGKPFSLRQYQRDAVDSFHAGGSANGGAGVVVLPCGAGKTIVGLGVMARCQTSTLILTTSVTAARQWIDEILDKTNLKAEQIGEYTGLRKQICPVTLTTYQSMTHRHRKEDDFTHLGLFHERDWGLIIYDEVHLLPAPVFQVTAELQARRRLGLTATLVREDGRQDDVFALIGPKRYDVPWKDMERQGWIAKAVCSEVRVRLSEKRRLEYAAAPKRNKFRIASVNRTKLEVLEPLLDAHQGWPTLVIGMYLDQLKTISKHLKAPLLTGQTGAKKREELYQSFRDGEIPILVVSKVANFAIDLPDAAVAIQVSGTFGSRQEEAQRLGRILRPKDGENQAYFYSIVTRDTVEQQYALHRQLFLTEQGYSYRIVDEEELFEK